MSQLNGRLTPSRCTPLVLPSPPVAIDVESERNLTHHSTTQDLVKVCDIVNVPVALYPSTERTFD